MHSSGDAKIDQVRAQKEAAIEVRDFEGAARLRDVERRLLRERFGPRPYSASTALAPPMDSRAFSVQWRELLVGASLLALGLLIARFIWG